MDIKRRQNQKRNRRGPGWGFTFFGGSDLGAQELKDLAEVDEESGDGLSFPLSQAKVGDRLWIVGFTGRGDKGRLLGMGLHPGKEIEVISKAPGGSVIVAVENNRIGVDGGMASKIMVSSDRSLAQNRQQNSNTHKTLKDLKVGAKGIVTHYQKSSNKHQKGYRRKLLAMGLTPGTEFRVTRVAPLGDPVEIAVRGFKLSLRKDEASSLGVKRL